MKKTMCVNLKLFLACKVRNVILYKTTIGYILSINGHLPTAKSLINGQVATIKKAIVIDETVCIFDPVEISYDIHACCADISDLNYREAFLLSWIL